MFTDEYHEPVSARQQWNAEVEKLLEVYNSCMHEVCQDFGYKYFDDAFDEGLHPDDIVRETADEYCRQASLNRVAPLY